MPYGRGGAGNFWQAEEDKKKAANVCRLPIPPPSPSHLQLLPLFTASAVSQSN